MSEPHALLDLIGRLEGGRVLCIGDVMLDRFVYGEVERISPEAPIPVLRVRREEAMLGGAGNVVSIWWRWAASRIFSPWSATTWRDARSPAWSAIMKRSIR
jgi:hypothetical protein